MSTYLAGFDTPRTIPLGLKIKLFFGDVLFLIGVFFTIFGSIFVLVFGANADFSSLNFSPDKKVSGKITSIEATGARENKQEIYKFGYQFTLDGDIFKSGESYYFLDNQKVGDFVEVEYESSTGKSCIKGMRMASFGAWVILLVMIFPLIGLVMLTIGTMKGIKNLDLITNGVLTKAKVVGKEPTNTKINNQTVFRIYFEFKDSGGKICKANCSTHKVYLVEDEPEEMMVYKSDSPENAVLLDTLHRSVKKFFAS